MRAKKSFGQHFLTNEDIARRIVEYGLQSKPACLLEIGPGKGVLTKYLLEQNVDLLVVEADQDMVSYLEAHFPKLQNRIIALDFLKLDLHQLFAAQPTQLPSPRFTNSPTRQFTLLGNFPYNISSQIVFKMVENRALVPSLVGMFQREMAERIVAKPGGKDYGVISVLTQAFYEGKLLMRVGNRNFNPPPKVESAVIQLLRKNETLGCDEILFRQLVKQTFNQRRKMLRNTLKPFFSNPETLEDDFFKKRPEELSVADFVTLTNFVGQSSVNP